MSARGSSSRGRQFTRGSGRRYNSQHKKTVKERVKLISDNDLDLIAKSIITYDTIMVTGPTGTGKSTIIPEYIARHVKYTDGVNYKILVSVPTKSSVKNLYTQAKVNIKGVSTGYAESGRVKYDNSTQLVYATTGHVKKRMLRQFLPQNKITNDMNGVILILDEFHMDNVDNSLIVALRNELMARGGILKTILMTATPIQREDIEIGKTIKVGKTNFSTSIVFPNMLGIKMEKNDYEKTMIEAAQYYIVDPNNTGHILMFVPGKKNANRIKNTLVDIVSMKELDKTVNVIEVHSGSPAEDIERALSSDDSTKNMMKVVVATNAAESSITIPDISVVIDSLKEKIPGQTKSGTMSLNERYISYQSSEQRMGRTGRTCNGIYLPCATPSKYDSIKRTVVTITPEILRVNIDRDILDLYALGINPVARINGYTKEMYNKFLKHMKQYGTIDDKGFITEYGKFAAILPTLIEHSKFLWEWISKDYSIYWGCVIIAILESEPNRLFYEDKRQSQEFTGPDQLATILDVWLSFEVECSGSMKMKTNIDFVKEWCRDKYIDSYTLTAIVMKLIQIMVNVGRYMDIKDKITVTGISCKELMKKSIPILHDIYPELRRDGEIYVDKKGIKHTISTTVPYGVLAPLYILPLSQLASGKKNYVSLFCHSSFYEPYYKGIVNTRRIYTETYDKYQREKAITVDTSKQLIEFIDDIEPGDIGMVSIDMPSSLIPSTLLGKYSHSYSKATTTVQNTRSIFPIPPFIIQKRVANVVSIEELDMERYELELEMQAYAEKEKTVYEEIDDEDDDIKEETVHMVNIIAESIMFTDVNDIEKYIELYKDMI